MGRNWGFWGRTASGNTCRKATQPPGPEPWKSTKTHGPWPFEGILNLLFMIESVDSWQQQLPVFMEKTHWNSFWKDAENPRGHWLALGREYFDESSVDESGSHGLYACSSTHGLSMNGKVVTSRKFHRFLFWILSASLLASVKNKGEFESVTKPQAHLVFFSPPWKALWMDFYYINKRRLWKTHKHS